MAPSNLDQLARVYGPTTWKVYEQLDVSLDPAGMDQLHDIVDELIEPGNVVLDVGCRDASHLVRLVQRHDIVGVGIEPVARHVERGRGAVTNAALEERITLTTGVVNDLPFTAGSFDVVWCRDVLEQVDDLAGGLADVARVTRSGGRMVVYTTFVTELLAPAEAAMLGRHLGNVFDNLDRGRMEREFESAGWRIDQQWDIGTEWREHAEEHFQVVSTALLRLSRLRRQREKLVAEHGRDIHDHIEANLHWEVFQFLGKLAPVVYVLVKAT